MADNNAPGMAGFQQAGAAAEDCHVCGETLSGAETALCRTCDRSFHLRSREDAPGRDCGEVWMSEQWLTLEFACLVCLGRAGGSGAGEPAVGTGH
jgi:hypothetical protein